MGSFISCGGGAGADAGAGAGAGVDIGRQTLVAGFGDCVVCVRCLAIYFLRFGFKE